MYEEIDKFARARIQLRLGELLGGTHQATQVLEGLVNLLHDLNEPAAEEPTSGDALGEIDA